jgi:hypothetical protein
VGRRLFVIVLSLRIAFMARVSGAKKPHSRKAGLIPLAGLVFVHSRHSRDFMTRSQKPQDQNSRMVSERAGRCCVRSLERFLGAVAG